MIYNIAIDGPSGSGKSTIAKLLSKKLNCIYIDTGSMYRSIAYYYLNNNIDLDDKKAVVANLDNITVELKYVDNMQRVFLNGDDVTPKLRTEEIGMLTSKVATISEVREKLVSLQQKLSKKTSVIMDGRDIGTVVLPDANLKIYLTASVEERSKRRYLELLEKNVSCTLEDVKKDLIVRDEQDMSREISPLKVADDAIVVDSTNCTAQEILDKIVSYIKEN